MRNKPETLFPSASSFKHSILDLFSGLHNTLSDSFSFLVILFQEKKTSHVGNREFTFRYYTAQSGLNQNCKSMSNSASPHVNLHMTRAQKPLWTGFYSSLFFHFLLPYFFDLFLLSSEGTWSSSSSTVLGLRRGGKQGQSAVVT